MMTKKYLVASFLALSLVALSPLSAFGAGSAFITLSPSSGSYKIGQTFNVNVLVNPGSDKIDTVRTKLNYSADVLEIKSFTVASAFSYQAGANSFDNNAGTFSWGAGIPGGTSSPITFGTIVFQVKKEGAEQVSVANDSMILSAGENKFNGQAASASFSLLAAVTSGGEAQQKPPVKNVQPAPVQNTQQPAQQATESSNLNNSVESQIITKPSPQSFLGSMAGAISLGTAIRLGSIILAILIIVGMGTLIYKTRKNFVTVFRKIKK
ncbi:MAG: cohesin domain-containing protein [Candidatus Staskawiczbacteria bacterium]|nr:cohesin domain-containing protein [Candidatus Staskawiczbacteria bacterium]